MDAVKSRAVLGRTRQRPSEQGQGLTEYALILVFIALIAILSLVFLGGQLSTILSGVGNSV